MNKRVLVAITGASGVRIGIRLVEVLSKSHPVDIIITQGAIKVAELEESLSQNVLFEKLSNYGKVYYENDFSSPYASSSSAPEKMIIAPASMKTIAMIALGISDNLVTRAALSMIRLRRTLVVAPRETPLGVLELQNLLRLAQLGVRIVPLMVAFYFKPEKISDIIDFLVGKIMDAAEIENDLYPRWGQ